MLKLSWCADIKAENDFAAMGIPFSVVSVPFAKIDLIESGFNSARLGDPIVPELVRDYAQGMRNGDTFPRPAAYRKGNYILTSGNQRCNAIKSLIESGEVDKNTMVDIYVLDTAEPLLIEAISRAANVSHGGRASWDERKAHACHMVREYGMSVRDAAKLFVIAESSITLQISADKTRKQLAESGIDTARLPTSVINAVGRLDSDSSVFLKAGQLFTQHQPTGDQAKQYVERISKAKSEDARLGVVKKIEKELADAARAYGNAKKIKLSAPRAPQRPRRDQIISQLKRLADFLDFGKGGEGFSSLGELQSSVAADAKAIADLWERIELRMSLILKERK